MGALAVDHQGGGLGDEIDQHQVANGRLARLAVQGKSLGDLVEVEVPREVQLYAPVVTKDNVDRYLPTAFES